MSIVRLIVGTGSETCDRMRRRPLKTLNDQRQKASDLD